MKFATLTEANFTGANLRGANLFEAYLERARFPGADLKGAILPTVIQNSAGITLDQIASADGTLVGTEGGSPVKSFLSEIDFKIDIEVRETKENRDKITARLDRLSSDVARLAGISKEDTPAKTVLAAIEASDLTPQIIELVSDAVLDCADME